MTSMVLQPLKKVQQAAHTAVQVQAAALAVSRAVLAAAVSRARGRIFMQRSGSVLKMQPLAVRK